MNDAVQLTAAVISVLLLAIVLELVRRRRLTEEYSVIWIACAAAMLVLSLWRDILHSAAELLEIHYPPALLLLLLIFFVFMASLHVSVVISLQRRQIERLTEEVALLDASLRALNHSAGTVPSDQMVPRAASHGSETSQQRHVG